MDRDIIRRTNVCAGIDDGDCERLWQAAAKMLDARSVVMKIVESIGHATSFVGGSVADILKNRLGVDASAKIQEIVQDLLWNFQSGAMTGLDPHGRGDRWEWLHKALVVASGASGGFFGLPGLLWDLPITTANIMRSVADIARSFPGEDIESDDTRRACIEVFAMGSPFSDDEDASQGYWAARAGLTNATIELLIRSVVAKFSATVSEKVIAQAVPLTGLAAGAFLNYAFIDYYQEMARVQFVIRMVERRAPDPSAVGPCFAAIVREVRSRRKIRSRPAE